MARGGAATSQDRADALLREVAVVRAPEIGGLEGAILDRLRDTVPEFFADDDVAYDMAAAVAANVRRFQQLLAHAPDDAMGQALPVEAGDLLHSTIQHGIPLISLLEAYRSAQGLAADWWRDRLDRAAPPAGLLSQATRTLNRLLLTYIDSAAAQVRASYEVERRALESSPDGRRAHLIRKLLAGEALDADAAARTLNHPLTGRHVALVLWRADDGAPADALQDALDAVAVACGPVRVLTTSAPHRVHAWLSTGGRIAVDGVRGVVVPDGVHVAMSGVHAGVEGFVRAHEEAVRTAGVVRDRGGRGDGRVHVYEQFELVTLLARDPDACERFVRRVLGRLADDSAAAERARRTLQVFLACGGSPSRAAARLGVHRNTVTYRLASIADAVAVGDGPGDDWAQGAARRLEVELALRIVDQLGPPDGRPLR